MVLSDPAATAWDAAGQPDVDAPTSGQGRCGRCGADGPTVASSRIISEKFTGFDAWQFGTRRLCTPCALAYRRPPTSQPAMLITTTSVTEYPERSGLAAVLMTGPLACTEAAIAPAYPRRHLLPTARWGHLATDTLVIGWDAAAARRLADAAWLRSLLLALKDTTEPTLRVWTRLGESAPPHRLLTSQPAHRWEPILSAWSNLQLWRSTPPLWAAARTLTDHATAHR